MLVFSSPRRWLALTTLLLASASAYADTAPASLPGDLPPTQTQTDNNGPTTPASPALRTLNGEADVLVILAALHEDHLNQTMTLLPLTRDRSARRSLERSVQLHAGELRTLRGWLSELPDRPPSDYLPRLPEPGSASRAQAERQYLHAMLNHHDALALLGQRASGLTLRPAVKTLLDSVQARSQAERPQLEARLAALND